MKTLLAAATFAVLAFGCTGAANATAVSGVHAAKSSTIVSNVTWHRHHKHRKCAVRHGHRHCWWR
ncbi:hypothetical protein DLM45_07065 [Hyphomicrobium methylovorum]|uniref:hypothetical protein n=1 Tax=Hyphomicrobium methylovorum TaxID=84 RepID=UPI0015E746BD|nr:hypothetical protein [Hyphomicrobium methylovorum]MBA2125983.1 hypothetical protein [Hyphomicrobium methylovorum]